MPLSPSKAEAVTVIPLALFVAVAQVLCPFDDKLIVGKGKSTYTVTLAAVDSLPALSFTSAYIVCVPSVRVGL